PISVSLWILNKNKTERIRKLPDLTRNFRARKNEVLFMDLREIGEPFEKKFIQFSPLQINKIAETYHKWQQKESGYEDKPEYCYSASIQEIEKKDFSLVPSKYIEFKNRDEEIDFDIKMASISAELSDVMKKQEESKRELLSVFKNLGY